MRFYKPDYSFKSWHKVIAAGAKNIKRFSLEPDERALVIICKDADLDRAENQLLVPALFIRARDKIDHLPT